jgi:hypothetical protein
MEIEKEFSKLESKFSLLDTKLHNKILLINNLHDSDANKINDLFNGDLENGTSAGILNEYREQLLMKIKEMINFDINEINHLANYLNSYLSDLNAYNPEQRARKISVSNSLLEFRYKEIKDNYLGLTKTYYTNSDLNRYKYTLTRPLNFTNLTRFKHFLKNEKSYNIELPESINELEEDFSWNSSVHILPTNKILLCVRDFECYLNMFIINEEGAIKYSIKQEINTLSDFKVCTSSTKIVYLYEISDEEESLAGAEMIKACVYDFKFNLILTFDVNTEYSIYFLLHNHEIALQNIPTNDKIKVYNLTNLNSKEIKLQDYDRNDTFHVDEFSDDLFHFDSKYFYFKHDNKESTSKIVYLVNRRNGLKVIEIKLDANLTSFINEFFISNKIDLNCLEYDAERDVYKIQEDLFKSLDSIFNDNEESFLKFSQFDSMVYNLIKTPRLISFEEY